MIKVKAIGCVFAAFEWICLEWLMMPLMMFIHAFIWNEIDTTNSVIAGVTDISLVLVMLVLFCINGTEWHLLW